jgi:hypothetical protein
MRALDEVKALPVITLGTIVDQIQEEALLIICLISILPFMQPIPIPGVSTILGIIALLQGAGLVLWSRPILTNRLKKVEIPHDRFLQIHRAAVKFSKFTQKISTLKHPVTQTRVVQILSGLSIVLAAAFLSLPLPIPFSNFVPALSIFLICIGLLEEDLVLLLCGHGITVAVGWMAMFSYHIILEQFHNWF